MEIGYLTYEAVKFGIGMAVGAILAKISSGLEATVESAPQYTMAPQPSYAYAARAPVREHNYALQPVKYAAKPKEEASASEKSKIRQGIEGFLFGKKR